MDIDRVTTRWGKGLAAEHIFPNRKGDQAFRRWFGRLQVQSATPKDAVAFMRMAFDMDVRHVVPSIDVPTLILHRTDDPVCHVENARWLARHIEGARYLELPGNDHVPWIEREEILAETQEFLTGVREPAEPDRVLATVLFTDIVGSTERARELGDRGCATCSSAITLSFGLSLLVTADARSTRPGTASSLPSTAPPEASAVRARSSRRRAGSGLRYAQACTPARSS